MSRKTLLTAAELEQMPDDDSVLIELDEGELITMPPAGFEHGSRGNRIAFVLTRHVREHDLGEILSADTGFRLSPDTVRAPDVSFVRKERLAEVRSKGFAKGAPDLAVEVFSPFDDVRQLMRKVKQYLAAGCHTVWIVYPERREVQILEASGTDRMLGVEDVLEAPELLPGFSIRISELFK